jgi:hypothetical protein
VCQSTPSARQTLHEGSWAGPSISALPAETRLRRDGKARPHQTQSDYSRDHAGSCGSSGSDDFRCWRPCRSFRSESRRRRETLFSVLRQKKQPRPRGRPGRKVKDAGDRSRQSRLAHFQSRQPLLMSPHELPQRSRLFRGLEAGTLRRSLYQWLPDGREAFIRHAAVDEKLVADIDARPPRRGPRRGGAGEGRSRTVGFISRSV